MPKIVMVYASLTGNTKAMADAIAAGIKEAGQEIDVFESYDQDASVLEDYDALLIGTYTWGDGDFPDEMQDFYDSLSDVDLTGKKGMVFGSFDEIYGDYGIAVDDMIEKLERKGCEVIRDGFKIELTPSPEQLEECKELGKWFVEQIEG